MKKASDEVIDKRMRDLMEGASIAIIPYPYDEYFGTLDEGLGIQARFLFLGFKKPESKPIWSLYGFEPSIGGFGKAIPLAQITVAKEGNPDPEVQKQLELEANMIKTRDNICAGFTITVDQIETIPVLKGCMNIDYEMINVPAVQYFIETILRNKISQVPNELNIYGDYIFLFSDYGYLGEDIYKCSIGYEELNSYQALQIYDELLNQLKNKKQKN